MSSTVTALTIGNDLDRDRKLFTMEGKNVTNLVMQPSHLSINIPTMNVNVILPMNSPVMSTQEIYEKGTDFIADLLQLEGVEEVLKKHGAQIKPI